MSTGIGYRIVMTLVIRDFRPLHDKGAYICRAANSLGDAEISIQLYGQSINSLLSIFLAFFKLSKFGNLEMAEVAAPKTPLAHPTVTSSSTALVAISTKSTASAAIDTAKTKHHHRHGIIFSIFFIISNCFIFICLFVC